MKHELVGVLIGVTYILNLKATASAADPQKKSSRLFYAFKVYYGIIIIAPKKNSHLVWSVWQASMVNK